MKNKNIKIGCGLIRIGRIWGVESKPIPSEKDVISFLERSYELGIRFYDTAPSYGLSEYRLGLFIENLTKEQKENIKISTKFGEHWNYEKNEPYVDFSYDSLMNSFDKSLKELDKIDILQLHKTSKDILNNYEVTKALNNISDNKNISIGASISDIETGVAINSDPRFEYIQLPYNKLRTELLPVINAAKINGKKILFNRPLAMGEIVSNESKIIDKEKEIFNAYSLIINTRCEGYILSGTANQHHLEENISIFEKANL